MPNVTPAFYPERFFGVCKDMWNYTESSQTAAHITNCKNIDFESSPLTACYLNCSTTFHVFKNLTDLQKSRTKTKSGNRPNQILPTASLYACTHTHMHTHPLFPCKKQNWLPQTNTFFLIFSPDSPSFASPYLQHLLLLKVTQFRYFL